MKNLPLSLLIVSIFACSCKKNSSPGNAAAVTVYAAGYYIDSLTHNQTGICWKDGVAMVLSRDTNSTGNFTVTSMAVAGNDIYVAGTFENNHFISAVYWKNGTLVYLTEPSLFLAAAAAPMVNAIAAAGNDIYIAGRASGSAVYWKNNNMVPLQSPSIFNEPTGIFVSGTDVYISGYSYSGGALYWKNGTPVTLSNAVGSLPTCITVAGNDVYVGGGTSSYAGYWKNGVFVTIGDPSVIGIRAITTEGNDVYTAGTTLFTSTVHNATYWKNGNTIPLFSKKGIYSDANAMAVSGNNVYIGGSYMLPADSTRTGAYINNNTFTLPVPCYWENGIPVRLPCPSNEYVSVTSLLVR